MSKTNGFENSLLALRFNATAISNIADNAASSPNTNVYVSLHDTWPGEAGSQTTGEVAYTNYARVAVSRSSGGWTVSGNSVSPASQIVFPSCGASGATANFVGVGRSSSGAGTLDYCFPIGAAPTIVVGLATDTLTSIAHGLAVDDPVVLFPAFANALPTGITEGTVYYVKTAPDADTFTLSATIGGATMNITAAGAGIIQKITPYVITSGVTPTLTTATAVLED